MKLVPAGLVGLILVAATGCGPGLSHRVKAPEASNADVFSAMDAELAHAMVSTTTLTSGEPMPMPESRMSAAEAEPAASPSPTWGSGEAVVAEPTAKPANDFDMHPYD